MVKFYNTLTRIKEEFTPYHKGKVRMYNCGPTIYFFAHIGNFRAYAFADLIRRHLEYRQFQVHQVMNLTDVDDKTIKGSISQEVPLKDFTSKFEKAFFEDLNSLNILKASEYPRATEHVKEMVEIIEILLKKGYAYKAEDGIYFSISKLKDYGKLAHLDLKNLKSSGRVKNDAYEKEQVSDFALWKNWDENDGDVYWNTSLGRGRPGWHIECSAMSRKHLGECIDIHTGGVDNIFPHHENEIAQSEAAFGKEFVKYWMHCEHLLVDGKKMSKSLGNFFTLRDILSKGFDAMAVRFLLLSTHYRSQLNFTLQSLKDEENTLSKLNEFVSRLGEVDGKGNKDFRELLERTRAKFVERMDDDLDVANSLSVVFEFVKKVNKMIEEESISKKQASEAAGFMLHDFNAVFAVLSERRKGGVGEKAEEMIAEREAARKRKDFRKADSIRKELKEIGVVLEDTPRGVRWRKA